jgi:hypothetical protein
MREVSALPFKSKSKPQTSSNAVRSQIRIFQLYAPGTSCGMTPP